MKGRIGISAAAALWASAFVVMALIIVQAGTVSPASAQADMVSKAGEYTVLSTNAGSEDIIIVLDNRAEELMAYKIVNQSSIQLLQKTSLPETFIRGRAGAQGRP